MKWKNKGHEFDNIAKIFENIDKVYIYGAGIRGTRIFKSLEAFDCVQAFIDLDINKQTAGYMGKPVLPLRKFLEIDRANSIVVVSISSEAVLKTLILSGYELGINCFDYEKFYEYYMSIFALYKYNKLVIPRLYCNITEFCTLNCKYCSAQIPYIHNPKHLSLDYIIENLDSLFYNIDYLAELRLTGGEALMHPQIKEIIQYAAKKVGTQLGSIRIITNGNTKINEKILQLLAELKVVVFWTNYLNVITDDKIISRINSCLESLKKHNINVIEVNHKYWEDSGFKSLESTKTPDELRELYYACEMKGGCVLLAENSIFSCGSSTLLKNEEKQLTDEGKKDCIPLNSENKALILEGYMGFTQNGYLEACKYCQGRGAVNTKKVPVAEQI